MDLKLLMSVRPCVRSARSPLDQAVASGGEDGKKGSKKALAWTPESEKAFDDMEAALLTPLTLHLLIPDKAFVLRTNASD